MTDVATAPLAVDPLALGEAAVAALAAVPDLRVDPVGPGDAFPLPPVGARVVVAELGNGARAILAVGADAAAQLPGDLAVVAAEVLAVVAGAAGTTLAASPGEVPADPAAFAGAEVTVAARLLSAETHVATVAVSGPADALAAALVHEFGQLADSRAGGSATGLEVLHEVALGVTAELGRTQMLVRDVLSLAPGSVIELDRAAGSPVDVLVNGTLIARGEVVVIDEEFGIRITEVVGYSESAKG